MARPNVYLASPVFREMAHNPLVSQDKREKTIQLFQELEHIATLFESSKRFPTPDEIKTDVQSNRIEIIGCHLSHTITEDVVSLPHLKAVCTATAGYNHIAGVPNPSKNGQQPQSADRQKRSSSVEKMDSSSMEIDKVDPHDPPLLITHTPSVLHDAVSDFIIALILSALKNVPTLNRYVFEGQWRFDQKWDMDAFLGRSLSSLTLGIIGMGEIGQTVVTKLVPWKMPILYFSRTRKHHLEKRHPNLIFCQTLEDVFKQADILSLNVPLTDATRHLANERTLSMMKPGALLVNTARGDVVDLEALISLLEAKKVAIDLAFDVFDPEPIPKAMLDRFHEVSKKQKERKFIFMPHTASADADTRAQMVIMMLRDIITIVQYLDAISSHETINDSPNRAPSTPKDENPETWKSKGFKTNGYGGGSAVPDYGNNVSIPTVKPTFPDIHLIPELRK